MKGHFTCVQYCSLKRKFSEMDLYCFIKIKKIYRRSNLVCSNFKFYLYCQRSQTFVYMLLKPVMDFRYAGHVTGLVCGVHFCNNTLGKGTMSPILYFFFY